MREEDIGVPEFSCIGESPPHNHPQIYLKMGRAKVVICPYCSTVFRWNPLKKSDGPMPLGILVYPESKREQWDRTEVQNGGISDMASQQIARKPCSDCQELVILNARLCPHCGSPQLGWRKWFRWVPWIVGGISIATFLFGIGSFIVLQYKNAQIAEFYLSSARGYVRIELFEEGRDHYHRVLAIKPYNYEAILGESKAKIIEIMRRYGLDHWLVACDLAQRLLERNQRDADLLAILARLETLLIESDGPSDWKENALNYADRALEIDSTHPQALLSRAIALRKLERSDEAFGILIKLVEDEPNYERAYFYLGQLYKYDKEDEHAKAEQAYRMAIRLDPDLPGPKVELGKLLVLLGVKESDSANYIEKQKNFKVREGLALLYNAISLAPSSHFAHRFLGRSLVSVGKYDAGVRELDIARCLVEEGKYNYSNKIPSVVSSIEREIQKVLKGKSDTRLVYREPGSCLETR